MIAIGAFSVVLVAFGSILMLWRARETTIEEWKINLSNMSSTLAESINQTMKAADLVLKSITDRVEDADIINDEQLRQAMGTQEIFEMLRYKASSVPQVDVATIVARNGDIINFTRSYPPPKINLSDRDYFKAHMADPKLDVYLNTPVQNCGTGAWTFYLARKIRSRTWMIPATIASPAPAVLLTGTGRCADRSDGRYQNSAPSPPMDTTTHSIPRAQRAAATIAASCSSGWPSSPTSSSIFGSFLRTDEETAPGYRRRARRLRRPHGRNRRERTRHSRPCRQHPIAPRRHG